MAAEAGLSITAVSLSPSTLTEYAQVPIAFEVDRVLELVAQERGLGGFILVERPLTTPYLKDYDAVEGERPIYWPVRFDVSNWGMVVGRRNGRFIGGAIIACKTPGVNMLEGRDDLAVLWDIRVQPAWRGQGVGTALFQAAEKWATAQGCRQLKIETQNINVAACRFYARQGCGLGAVNHFAYSQFPDEVQLFWYKKLSAV